MLDFGIGQIQKMNIYGNTFVFYRKDPASTVSLQTFGVSTSGDGVSVGTFKYSQYCNNILFKESNYILNVPNEIYNYGYSTPGQYTGTIIANNTNN